jgi:predicted nucleotidyltransferase
MAYAGSIAYGTNTPTSDTDFRGIFLPLRKHILGLGDYDCYHSPEQSEEDMVLYSIKKYVRLALQNNPNVLEMMFTDKKHYTVLTEQGQILIDNRQKFLSKKCFNSFGGYAMSQLKRMTMAEGKPTHGVGNPSRQVIRKKFGYDTKAAMHLVRLMRMCVEILRDETLIVLRPDAKELLEIKDGEYTLKEIVEEHDYLYGQMKVWYEKSKLPEEPYYYAVENLLINLQELALSLGD